MSVSRPDPVSSSRAGGPAILVEQTPIVAAKGRLETRIRRVDELTAIEHEQMLSLLRSYFKNVTESRFEHDLAEKDWVCVGTDMSSGEIGGFSTLMRIRAVVDGEPLVVFFSGDTIMSREHWGHVGTLPRTVGRHMFRLVAEDELVRYGRWELSKVTPPFLTTHGRQSRKVVMPPSRSGSPSKWRIAPVRFS